MEIRVRKYRADDLPAMIRIWNEVVEEGIAFPQEELLDMTSGAAFFGSQSYSAVAEDGDSGTIYGLYILHPNNVGRCGHISNASYAVSSESRGLHIGEKLVRHSLQKGRELGFRVLQFNAVVASNAAAIRLYEKLGFVRLGNIPGGFCNAAGEYEDIWLFYHTL